MAPAAVASQVGARASFVAEAREQGECQVTKKPGRWHPHHVIYEQHLDRLDAPAHDNRNVLRVAEQAHVDHHSGKRKIRVRELRDCNIDYATYLMGTWRAIYYLRRYYDDVTEPCPRLAAIERKQQEAENG